MKTFFNKFNIDNIRYEYPINNSSINYKTFLLIINKFIKHYEHCKKNKINSHHVIIINNKKITLFLITTEYRHSISFYYRCDFNWVLYKILCFIVLRKYNFLKNDNHRFFHVCHLTIEGKKYYL